MYHYSTLTHSNNGRNMDGCNKYVKQTFIALLVTTIVVAFYSFLVFFSNEKHIQLNDFSFKNDTAFVLEPQSQQVHIVEHEQDLYFKNNTALVTEPPQQVHIIVKQKKDQKLLISNNVPRDQLTTKPEESGVLRLNFDSKYSKEFPNPPNKFFDSRFIVVPEYKLLFCFIEKVGCAMFNDISRLLRLVTGNLTTEEREFQLEGRWGRNQPKVHHLNQKDVENLLQNPTWTKGIFYRDPATRFLSFYRSKCKPPREDHGKHCRKVFGTRDLKFKKAIDMIRRNPSIIETDVHTLPMHQFCGGLQKTLPYYDFVRQLTPATSPKHISTLLDIVGVDRELNRAMVDCMVRRVSCEYLKQRVPEFGKFPKLKDSHITGSNRDNTLAGFYTDSLVQVIQTLYEKDYNLFNISKFSVKEIIEAGWR